MRIHRISDKLGTTEAPTAGAAGLTERFRQTGQAPSGGRSAVVYTFLRIGTDPTDWVLENTDPDTVTAQLSQADGPAVLPVVDPLQGDLIVSPSAAATIWVHSPPPVHGWRPSHIALPRSPVLYLPSPTSPTQDSPGYQLDPNTDLAALERDIIAAMSGRTVLSIQVAGIPGGVVLLNGAALGFAVLAQVHS
jgi:hypothetical protein